MVLNLRTTTGRAYKPHRIKLPSVEACFQASISHQPRSVREVDPRVSGFTHQVQEVAFQRMRLSIIGLHSAYPCTHFWPEGQLYLLKFSLFSSVAPSNAGIVP